MATTSNYQLPYPEASDPVDVAGDIEALAKKIDGDLREAVQDTVGGMVSSNTESGISVTYNDDLGKLNFNVTVIPTQAENEGKYLTTNGTVTSWATVDSLPDQTGNTGKFLTTDGTDADWATVDALPDQTGNNGKFLTTDGTDATWAEIPEGGSISVSESAPESPEQGNLWFNSTNAVTYIFYDSSWIELSPAIAGPQGEPGADGVDGVDGAPGLDGADGAENAVPLVNGAVTTASTSLSVVRNITLSTSAPSGGMDGDVWMVYS
jgi:hypothetical protein